MAKPTFIMLPGQMSLYAAIFITLTTRAIILYLQEPPPAIMHLA